MTQDNEYKGRQLQGIAEPARPTLYWPRGNGTVRSDKTGALFQAQDSSLVGRRILLQFGPGSPAVRIPSNDNPYDTGGSIYPNEGEEQELARTETTLTPGSWQEMRALLLPTGPIQDGVLPAGVQGNLRADVAYTDLATVTSQTVSDAVDAPGSNAQFGGLPTGDGSYFDALRPRWVGPLRPTPVNDDATAALYGEETVTSQRVSAVESCRVVSACISEIPWRYVTKHDQTQPTAHAAASVIPPDINPREATQSGTTYLDDRYGTRRMLDAAELAPLRLGPVLMQWTAYAAADWAYGATAASINVVVPAGAYQRVNALDTSVTEYLAQRPGWPIMAHLAQTYNVSGFECMQNQAAAVPCTLSVRYSGTVTGQCFFAVRTERSCVRVELTTQASTITATATGHIEGSATTEDALSGVAQMWLEGSDFDVELVTVTLEWGHIRT